MSSVTPGCTSRPQEMHCVNQPSHWAPKSFLPCGTFCSLKFSPLVRGRGRWATPTVTSHPFPVLILQTLSEHGALSTDTDRKAHTCLLVCMYSHGLKISVGRNSSCHCSRWRAVSVLPSVALVDRVDQKCSFPSLVLRVSLSVCVPLGQQYIELFGNATCTRCSNLKQAQSWGFGKWIPWRKQA